MNSATNPRKFAEKIAKLHQKEQEQTQAFEQIMAEVIVATRGGQPERPKIVLSSKHHLHINQSVASSRAESLPNVNHISRSAAAQNSIDLQAALSNLEDIKQGKSPGRERRHSPGGLLAPSARGQSPRSIGHAEHRRASPASPYSTPYLSPPDTWRRTNSDSALHQSSILADRNNKDAAGYSVLQHSSRRSPTAGQMGSSSLTNISNTVDSGAQSTSESWDDRNRSHEYHVQVGGHPDANVESGSGLRPKSCDVPGITIFPSQEPDGGHSANQAHIPISANTGSLPDLSSFHFPAPLPTPIDSDELAAAAAAQSSISTPASNSHSSSLHYPNTNPGSPFASSRQQPASPYSVNSNPNSPFSPQSPLSALGYSPPSDAGHLMFEELRHLNDTSVPQQVVCYPSNSYRNSTAPAITVEGLAMDTSALSLEANHRIYRMSPLQDTVSFNGAPSMDQHGLSYAPASQVQTNLCSDRNGTGSASNSAPNSPVTHQIISPAGPGPGNESGNQCVNPNFQANVLQHQFEQFKMVNDSTDVSNPAGQVQGSAGHSNSSANSNSEGLFMNPMQVHTIHHHQNKPLGQSYGVMTNDNRFDCPPETSGHYTSRNLPLSAAAIMSSSSPVPTLYSKSVISCAPSQYSQQRQALQSLQSATGIPDIVLTDADVMLTRNDFSKEMGSEMGSFDAGDLFSGDGFKSDLPIDPIDFDGLQILTEMTDSEERMDRS